MKQQKINVQLELEKMRMKKHDTYEYCKIHNLDWNTTLHPMCPKCFLAPKDNKNPDCNGFCISCNTKLSNNRKTRCIKCNGERIKLKYKNKKRFK